MVTVDFNKCTRCGLCIKRFSGFCMNPSDGGPMIDYDICNQCQAA